MVGIEVPFTVSTLRPVSYTHLDVYKRQVRFSGDFFKWRSKYCGEVLFKGLGDSISLHYYCVWTVPYDDQWDHHNSMFTFESKDPPDWLLSYKAVTRPVPIIFKMVGYILVSPRMFLICCEQVWLSSYTCLFYTSRCV